MRLALLGRRRVKRVELTDLVLRKEGEELEIFYDVAVVGVVPELVESVRRSSRRVEPDGTAFGFSEFDTGRGCNEVKNDRVRFCSAQSTDEFDTRNDVTPLIAATHLECTAMPVEEFEVVVGLQERVSEFGE